MRAYVYVNFVSGLGDTYTTILSSLECSMELKNFGYDTYLILNTSRNNYIPENLKLDCLFNFNDFENEIIYNPPLDSEGNPIIDGVNMIRVSQNQTSYIIYVEKYSEYLENYESYIFGHTEINKNSRRPICNTDIVSETVKEIANDFINNYKNIITLHYRAMDGLGNSETYLRNILFRFDEFVKNNKTDIILVCSNGKIIREYLKSKYDNVITFNFTHKDIELYPCYDIYNKDKYSDEVFIRHSQEIMAEMVMIRNSKKILSISPFLSNFVSYGIINNDTGLDYHDFFKHETV